MAKTVSLRSRLVSTLEARRDKGLYFELRAPEESAIDFASNDYLGSNQPGSPFQKYLEQTRLRGDELPTCSTGSRLMTGHTKAIERFEVLAAKLHGAEAALLFNSGYDANLSLLGTLPGPDDCFVFDEFVHASAHDGMRLSRARSNLYCFDHSNISSMTENIIRATKEHSGTIFVCVETAYSMDGDVAPLTEMLEKCRTLMQELGRDVFLIADEAHSAGLFGENGAGFVSALKMNTHPNLIGRLVTFGKAFAAHGSVILGPKLVIRYLINHSRPFLFSAALPPKLITAMTGAYQFAFSKEAEDARKLVWERVAFFNRTAAKYLPAEMLPKTNGESAVQVILVPGVRPCIQVCDRLVENGFNVYPVGPPAVPAGGERLRCVIHAHNSEQDIERFLQAVAKAKAMVDSRL